MNEKRQLLVKTALHLFYDNGINSVGINEVLKVSGVAKKTLYHHFQSKEQLILAVLEERHNIFIEWLTLKLKASTSPQDLIERLFTALKSWFDSDEPMLGHFRGCFFINSAAEFGQPNNEVALYCCKHKHDVRNIIEQFLPGAPPTLVDTICLMKEGAITTAYVTGQHDVTKQCIKMLTQVINKPL
ncbi:TetR/AcrR family transcriptional regulator [Vibrio aphrogenes]|uniref:TetR/AcrR family transcriptional regulator n=1 Tax=Vibrio aphrogenes TaxID=1891186 RepID=UPI000B35FE43|nr:TetR/AcrR family transcriptional regulator [Vibrio aphrogenes]